MDFPITMADAHTFAQGLIADGWLNDDPNCVDTLHHRLTAFAGICAAIAAMQKSTGIRCPECCARNGEPHAAGCRTEIETSAPSPDVQVHTISHPAAPIN